MTPLSPSSPSSTRITTFFNKVFKSKGSPRSSSSDRQPSFEGSPRGSISFDFKKQDIEIKKQDSQRGNGMDQLSSQFGSRVRLNDEDEPYSAPFVIGVAGGGASGKTTVCQMIVGKLAEAKRVFIVKMEDFYKPLSPENLELARKGAYNFDHPNSVDFDLLETAITTIVAGRSFELPAWDFATHTRKQSGLFIHRPDIVFFEGTLILYKKKIREMFNLRAFVDVDSDLRLSKQVVRDTEERYRKKIEDVLNEYLNHVKPSFEEFILPTKKFGDVIIPRGQDNTVAIELLAKHITDIIKERSDERSSHPKPLGSVVGNTSSLEMLDRRSLKSVEILS
ncbi:Uridine-cytidine kinase 2 [Irineochytrium annulatum]|nr:Uridine-cytidine kinase 2 [Irineochytrium annulatum]